MNKTKFKDVIKTILDNPEFITSLSDEFEVNECTVKRWADGVSNPHDIIKKKVVEFINELIEVEMEIIKEEIEL